MSTSTTWLERSSLYVALLVAWVATLGSLYFSEVAGYVPCTLCWYQRILMYPLSLVLAVGLIRRDENLPFYVLPLSFLGLGFATYHYLLEKTDLFGTSTVCQMGVSCVIPWINWFGFITIPFLALVAFLMITVLSAIALNAGEPQYDEKSPAPWLPVTAIALATLLAYGALAWVNRPQTTPAVTFSLGDTSAATEQSPVSAAPPAQAEPAADGARLYSEACAVCHGAAGEGVPNLGNAVAGTDFVRNATDAELLHLIRQGRVATDPDNQTGLVMPPSGGRPDLTDDEMLAIIQFLRGAT
jgi:disulfide bond formation protein DsbB/cytochrome c5